MSEPFLGQISIVSFNFPPKGWAFCNGQLLPINQNQALFSLLGTMYGGDGRVNFALPNLQGRAPVHVGNDVVQGQAGGEQGHTLGINEIPQHAHVLNASADQSNSTTPAGALLSSKARRGPNVYETPPGTAAALSADAVSNTGGSQAHLNLQPLLVLNFIIALQGIFPSQN